ncbi:Integrin alpha-X [Varanus komodoensis]|nr:Integrin alpha-X [Varanus komodoensis]
MFLLFPHNPPVQRIAAKSLSSTLQFFGQSIQGRMDLSGDELTDITIGALGNAVLLRSRPVFTIISSLSFSPPSIPLEDPNCGSGKVSGSSTRGTLSLCFTLELISTKWSHGDLQATISFHLQSDAAQFSTAQSLPRLTLDNEAPSSSGTVQVGLTPICINKTLQAQACLDDTFTPVVLWADFSVQEQPEASSGLRPVLDPETNTSTMIKVPFKQDCGPDDICVADLRVSFNFSGSKGLPLSPNFILNLTVKLENIGETAYEPALFLYYSQVLSFQGASVLQSNWRLSPVCNMHEPQGNTSTRQSSCRFSPPALKRGTQAFLRLSFRSSQGDSWPDKLVSFVVQARSQNENETLGANEATGQLPVLHPVNVIVKRLESTTYLNFSTESPEKKLLTHAYEVRNINRIATPVNVTFELPLKNELGFFWNVTPVHSDVKKQFSCTPLFTLRTGFKAKDLEGLTTRGCLGASVCTKVTCQITSLSKEQWVQFNFSGEFYRQDNSATLRSQKLYLCSEASVVVDETRFFQNQPKEFHVSQISTELELISPFNPVPIIIGSTFGGLLVLAIVAAALYKFGFFKRNRVPHPDESPGGQAVSTEQPPPEQAAAASISPWSCLEECMGKVDRKAGALESWHGVERGWKTSPGLVSSLLVFYQDTYNSIQLCESHLLGTRDGHSALARDLAWICSLQAVAPNTLEPAYFADCLPLNGPIRPAPFISHVGAGGGGEHLEQLTTVAGKGSSLLICLPTNKCGKQ